MKGVIIFLHWCGSCRFERLPHVPRFTQTAIACNAKGNFNSCGVGPPFVWPYDWAHFNLGAENSQGFSNLSEMGAWHMNGCIPNTYVKIKVAILQCRLGHVWCAHLEILTGIQWLVSTQKTLCTDKPRLVEDEPVISFLDSLGGFCDLVEQSLRVKVIWENNA